MNSKNVPKYTTNRLQGSLEETGNKKRQLTSLEIKSEEQRPLSNFILNYPQAKIGIKQTE